MDEKQAAELLWDEWKYRHGLYWKTLFRWGGAVVTLLIIPFIKPEIFSPLPIAALAFPLLAFCVSVFSAWLIGAEQRRFQVVSKKYDELRKDFLPPRLPDTGHWDKFLAAPIGAKIVPIYGVSLAILSIIDGILLWYWIKLKAPIAWDELPF
jgi:hypothetical protein